VRSQETSDLLQQDVDLEARSVYKRLMRGERPTRGAAVPPGLGLAT
jgi:hypothetical protein